jgi:Na+/proline symporter
LAEASAASLRGGFGLADWLVVAALFALTSWIGHRTSGKPATIRDFFLGGRKLPWYAVAGSIVATEISAVTLISLPATVFVEGGNLTYLQLGLIGLFLARWIVALVLIPAYFEREVYSPYDYIGGRLGGRTRELMTVLFALGGVLGQSARVYLTGLVLEVVLRDEFRALERHTGIPGIAAAIAVIGVVAVVWTWAGGMATVIWTDVVLFVVFLIAIAGALVTLVAKVDGGAAEIASAASEAGKLRFFDATPSAVRPYTIWAALIANAWVGVGAFGTDQLMAQRVFCCKNAREAQKAMIASYASMIVAVLVALIGLGLYAFYRQHPLQGEALELFRAKQDRIFPIFIVSEITTPLRGLIVAGVFAAAISSLDSILAALAQTALSAFWLPRQGSGDDAERQGRAVRASRALVLAFGVLLCFLAVQAELVQLDQRFKAVLDLALSLPSYTQGALLAGFALAFCKWKVDGSGLLWSAPLSVLTVFAVAWHAPWAEAAVAAGALALLVAWLAWRVVPSYRGGRESAVVLGMRTLALLGGLGLALWIASLPTSPAAWPWWVPIGSTTAFLWGLALARKAS